MQLRSTSLKFQLAEDLIKSGREFDNLDPNYRHDLRPYLVVFTLGRLRMFITFQVWRRIPRFIKSGKQAGLSPFAVVVIVDPVIKKRKQNNVYIQTSTVAWSIWENNANGKNGDKNQW